MGRVRLLVETSALVAIALEEPGWEKLAEAIASANNPVTTCINVFEAALALSRVRELAPTETHSLVERLVAALGVEVAGISPEMIALAALARQRFGAGRYGLNFGDCLSYAAARHFKARLLYVGNDFAATDVND
ncbi:ribonuclease VapC [Rhodoblastus acidophilus]|uniref:type II toxin-antitoxin system VapC family toxin n=1 Tax=Rhodoblastus acidophilus TaxID=1074 RepID=UPI002224EE0C|nr:type II toxin-antitoxin system VapC family toxin [Rhodoblastus acidophilus]MCW2333542.1 ribonuclease VapC [Rhodoblastus acidophilus]